MALAPAEGGAFSGVQRDALRVSLQYLATVPGGTRLARRSYLIGVFERTAAQLSKFGVQVDLGSLGVSGQNLEATVPSKHYHDISKVLAGAHIRMKHTFERRATLT